MTAQNRHFLKFNCPGHKDLAQTLFAIKLKNQKYMELGNQILQLCCWHNFRNFI